MNEPQDKQLLERIEKLEHAVTVLQTLVTQWYQTPQAGAQAPTVPVAAPASAPPEKRAFVLTPSAPAAVGPISRPPAPPPGKPAFELPAHMRSGEYWLGKVGIALLLFGVAFLFKYSIDQGWLTPSVRVLFGLALGAFLIFQGLRLHVRRRHFSQLLLGGGVATFYISGFAAYQVLRLVSHPVALGFMAAVTVLAFVLSLAQDEVSLALIGALGGLGTPFLLYTEGGSLPGLVGYTCLVLAGTTGIYFFKGWRSLLWTSVVGGWIVFLIGLDSMPGNRGDWGAQDQWALQFAALFAWGAFWALPVLRELAAHRRPERWTWPSLDAVERRISREARELVAGHVHLLTVSTPLVALFYSDLVWRLADSTLGWITLGGALVYAAVAWLLRDSGMSSRFVYTHTLVSLLLFTASLSFHLSGDTLFIALTTEALVLHLVALRLRDRFVAIVAHALSVLVAVNLVERLVSTSASGTPLLNASALASGWAVVVGLALAFVLTPPRERRIYMITAQALLAALFARELDGSMLLGTLALQAVFIHLLAVIFDDRTIRVAGHLLMAAVAVWLADRLHLTELSLLVDARTTAFAVTQGALVDLLVIACGLRIAGILARADERMFYRVAVHVALLLWLWRAFVVLPNGQAAASIAWGVYAVLLLVFGLRRGQRDLRLAGLGTLLLVVAKLFLVDLADLAAIWRVLLFMGFGALFLLLSYYFRALWKPEKKARDHDAASG